MNTVIPVTVEKPRYAGIKQIMPSIVALKEACDDLTKRGIKFLQSNSSAIYIKNLYIAYNIQTIKANRAINSNGSDRGEVDEVLIRNYE